MFCLSLRSTAIAVGFSACLALLPAASLSANDLSGSWHGYWASESTGHRGPLNCTFTKLDAEHYRADFSGRFFKLIPFRYSVVLTVTASDAETVQLSGSQELGRRYGTFTYWANVSGDEFVADYSSCKDCGQFVLTRCCNCCE